MRKWCVLSSVGILIVLANLDMTIANMALAALAKQFSASLEKVQLVIISYVGAAALAFCLTGKLADFFAKKSVFLIGCCLFVLASFYMGALAHSIDAIIIARFIQGMGFAATLGLAIVLIVQAFPLHQKGFATGIAITLTGLGLALGPPLGGFILQNWGWPWVFLINVPFGIISIVLTYFVVPSERNNNDKDFKLDSLSTIFYCLGLLLLIYSLYSINGVSVTHFIFLLIVSMLCIVLFVRRSLKVQYPLINMVLMKNHIYFLIVLVRLIFMFVMASFLLVLPLYFQNILNYTEAHTGVWLLYMTAGIAIISPLVGKIMDNIGYKLPLLFAMIFLALSCVALFNLQLNVSFLLLVCGLVSFSLSNGMHIPSSINGALSQVSSEHSGTAVGLFFTVAMLGSMLGVAVSGFLLSKVSSNILSMNSVLATLHLSQQQKMMLLSAANGSQNLHQWQSLFSPASLPQLKAIVSHSFMTAFHVVVGVDLALAVISVLICLSLFKLRSNRPAI